MEIVPERSRTTRSLHNFTSLPCFNVTWGRRKQLRCVKDSDHCYYLSSSSSPPPVRRRFSADYDGDGIESVRERLMLDLRTQVNQMKDSIFKINHRNGENRPWNLRTRRAVCKNPNFNGGGGGGDRKVNFPAEIKSPSRKGCRGGEVEVDGAKPRARARAKFSVSLSKQEIDEDFVSILGNRPSRRPKKRAKYVQNQIDVLFCRWCFRGTGCRRLLPICIRLMKLMILLPRGRNRWVVSMVGGTNWMILNGRWWFSNW